jgi:hypothetical protein
MHDCEQHSRHADIDVMHNDEQNKLGLLSVVLMLTLGWDCMSAGNLLSAINNCLLC